jgi:hypothetical protein
MPPKGSKKAPKPTKNIMSTWPSPDPYDPANINPEHKLNTADHGFNRLGISNPIVTFMDPPERPKPPTFISIIDERAYLSAILQKLALARQFVEKEIELKLDTNRRMDKDVTAQLICAPPIVLNLQTQEVVRDLVKVRGEMMELVEKEGESAHNLQELGREFLWAWKELKGMLEWLVPGKSEVVRRGRAEVIMVEALGECLVEEEEEGEAGDGDDEGEGDGEKAFV